MRRRYSRGYHVHILRQMRLAGDRFRAAFRHADLSLYLLRAWRTGEVEIAGHPKMPQDLE